MTFDDLRDKTTEADKLEMVRRADMLARSNGVITSAYGTIQANVGGFMIVRRDYRVVDVHVTLSSDAGIIFTADIDQNGAPTRFEWWKPVRQIYGLSTLEALRRLTVLEDLAQL